MKKSALTLALASVMVLPLGSAHAAEGQINFIGEVTNSTCSLTGSDANISVQLGSYATHDINDNYGEYTDAVEFSIRLTGCDTSQSYAENDANFTFVGMTDGAPSLLALSGANSATNLAIGVARTGTNLADTENRVSFDGTDAVSITDLVDGENLLQLYAFYQKVNPVDPVAAGPANATLTFNVSYN